MNPITLSRNILEAIVNSPRGEDVSDAIIECLKRDLSEEDLKETFEIKPLDIDEQVETVKDLYHGTDGEFKIHLMINAGGWFDDDDLFKYLDTETELVSKAARERCLELVKENYTFAQLVEGEFRQEFDGFLEKVAKE